MAYTQIALQQYLIDQQIYISEDEICLSSDYILVCQINFFGEREHLNFTKPFKLVHSC